MNESTNARPVVQVARAQATSDGAGVRLARSLGTTALPMVDPFLMLDEFRSDNPGDYIAGFPNHPHRGFETVTIMLAGAMEHRDSRGNCGRLRAGSVQWMRAGRGIVHSEMPQQEDGLMWGFQLWVNLPAADKMSEPDYQDIAPEAIPEVEVEPGVKVRVIAGEVAGTTGPVQAGYTRPVLLDVRLDDGKAFDTPVPEEHAVFLYPYEGSIRVPGRDAPIERGQAVVLGEGSRVELAAAGGPARALVVGGRPIREPVARYGPFVMSSRAELEQAFRDYQAGTLGR